MVDERQRREGAGKFTCGKKLKHGWEREEDVFGLKQKGTEDNAKEKASFYPHTCTAGKNINEKGEMRQFPPNKHPHGSYITVWRRITLTNVPNV